MRVPRGYVPQLLEDSSLSLEGEQAAHFCRVLRLKPGAEVELFDGSGGAARYRLEEVERRSCRLSWERELEPELEPMLQLTCAIGFPKGKRSQRLVEALTELRVSRLVPLALSRCHQRPPTGEAIQRWSLEAMKQCGRNRLLQADAPCDLEGLLARARTLPLRLLCDTGSATHLRELLPAHPQPQEALAVIGPEGGFEEDERARLLEAGFQRVSLSRSVLRIETAATLLAGALQLAWS